MKKDDRKQLTKNTNKYEHFQPLIVKADLHLMFSKSWPTSVSRVSRSGSATEYVYIIDLILRNVIERIKNGGI